MTSGTGHSSIIQLQEFPVDQLKLERRFVTDMARNRTNALIVRYLLQLRSALGIETVAEGVEDRLVADLLSDLGCDQARGCLYARSMSAVDLNAWLAARNPWQMPTLHPPSGVLSHPSLADRAPEH